MLDDFPGQTETDLYLFTMDHLHALREQLGPGVSPARGVEALERRKPPAPPRREPKAPRLRRKPAVVPGAKPPGAGTEGGEP